MKTLLNKTSGLKLAAVLGLAFHLTGLTHVAMAKQKPATAAAPTITVNYADGVILHKSDGMDIVRVVFTSPVGLKGATLSGANTFTRAFSLNNTKSATLALSLFVSYYPVGKYPMTATATDLNGKVTTKTVNLTLAN